MLVFLMQLNVTHWCNKHCIILQAHGILNAKGFLCAEHSLRLLETITTVIVCKAVNFANLVWFDEVFLKKRRVWALF
jgi:hypothetical protein